MDKELVQLNDFYQKCMEKVQEWHLKPFETDFHVVPAHKIYEVASYGLPSHFSHWTYGRDYWRQKTQYDHGYGRIYELVINANPAQAFLLDTNDMIDNMFVIAHVCGHSSFFAENIYFADTNRQIEYSSGATAERFREYEIKYGRHVVEEFIDNVITINYHINMTPYIKRKTSEYDLSIPEHQYIDLFPEDKETIKKQEQEEKTMKDFIFPYEPDPDLLGFIGEHGRLKDWQRDIVLSIKEEMEYFRPQIQTKIMNEGWASLIHHKLMHELDPEIDPGGIDFADIHSSIIYPHLGSLNPYFLGFNMYKRIIERWDDPSDDDRKYNGMVGHEGWAKALEVMRTERDETFLRNYIDEKICEDLDLFTFEFDQEESWVITEKDWERVRDNLVASKNGLGIPTILVYNSDYNLAGQLWLRHEYDGRPLDLKWASETLKAVCFLWGKPVFLETKDDDGEIILECKDSKAKVIINGDREI